jgi:hypothetical protein
MGFMTILHGDNRFCNNIFTEVMGFMTILHGDNRFCNNIFTEVMGFMTILHGDNRFCNNIFVQKWPFEDYTTYNDQDAQQAIPENRVVGTHVFDEYPTYDEWIAQFDFSQRPDMRALEPAHFGHLPVWSEGNVYLNGARSWKSEVNGLLVGNHDQEIKVELEEKDGQYYLNTNVFDYLKDFNARMINTEILGKAFEPEQYFENTDGTPIRFDTDYFGNHRGVHVIPGPFASPSERVKL